MNFVHFYYLNLRFTRNWLSCM